MTKPTTFPFLAIAKRHSMEYGDVLAIAHFRRFDVSVAPLVEDAFNVPLEALDEIDLANAHFAAIERGEIDWLTGERIGEKHA